MNDSAGESKGALDGVRVIDLSQIAAGPYLSSMLGDFGADVIKIEPLEGEPFRRIDNDFIPGTSGYFAGLNRSKRDLTLSLKAVGGLEVLDRLIASADVFITAMRPAATERLGIGYKRLNELNPKLIYCSLTAFGESGPRADEPGMDIIAQALGGMMATTGEPGRAPVKVGSPISDFATAFLAGFAICAALRARDRDGVGQKISLNLLDSTVALLANYVTPYFATGKPVRPVGGGHPQLVPYQAFLGGDGEYFIVACLNDNFWRPLCLAIDRPDLIEDQRFRTNPDRVRNRDEIVGILSAVFTQSTRGDWVQKLRQFDVPAAPVLKFEEVFEDPQVVHNKTLLHLNHPEAGEYKVANNPIQMTRTPARPTRYAPRLGEDNKPVLMEVGYSKADIEDLIRRGVIGG